VKQRPLLSPHAPVPVLVVADDLSGGADAGVQFARPGRPSLLQLDPGHRPTDARRFSAWVVDTESRSLAAADAAARVTRCCPPGPAAQCLYKKIDSTLRGNIGAEIEALMSRSGIRRTLICPAYPDQGRKIVGGRLYIGSDPMQIRSGVGQEMFPHTNHLPSLLRNQTSLPVIELERPAAGRTLQELLAQVEQRAEGIFVLDASNEAELERIAQAGLELGSACLLCGSAGLAAHFSRQIDPKPPDFKPLPINCGKILVVAGSRQAVTLSQIERLLGGLPAQVVPLVVGVDRHVHLAAPIESIPADELLVLSSASLPYLEGREEQIAGDLAHIARRVVRACRMEAMVLTGGATALAVCRDLGVGTLEIIHEILPGVPLSRVLDGKCGGTWVVTKAGGFGDRSTLVRILEFMKGMSIDG